MFCPYCSKDELTSEAYSDDDFKKDFCTWICRRCNIEFWVQSFVM